MKRDSFIFYKSFYESIKELEPKEQVEIYNAIFEYQFEGKEPKLSGISKSIFTLILPQLEANNKRFLNGCKGGAPKGNQNASKNKPKNNQKTTKKQPNVNDNDNVNENVNDNDNDIYTQNFSKFWKAYPKKRDKGNAEKWFKKHKPSEELTNLMIKQIERFKDTKDWKKQDGQFIPYPTTWLNAKMWEDEFETETEQEERIDREIIEGTYGT